MELDIKGLFFDFEINAFNDSGGGETNYSFINVDGKKWFTIMNWNDYCIVIRKKTRKDAKVTDKRYCRTKFYRDFFKYILLCGFKNLMEY